MFAPCEYNARSFGIRVPSPGYDRPIPMTIASISTADGRSPGQHGAVLLRCGTRPLFPLLWIFGGAALSLWAVLRMTGGHAAGPLLTLLAYVKIGILLILGLPAIIIGARELRKPTVMFEVTERGIMVYRNGGMYLRRDLFVPWERIRELRYITYGHPDFRITRTGFGPGSKQQSAIGLRLQMDENWPPLETLMDVRGVEIKDEIFLDSESSSPSGRELFNQIQKIRTAVVCGQPDSRQR